MVVIVKKEDRYMGDPLRGLRFKGRKIQFLFQICNTG